MTEKGEKN